MDDQTKFTEHRQIAEFLKEHLEGLYPDVTYEIHEDKYGLIDD